MAIINQATKELQVKIVYYGPAMGGKTTNLVQVHDHVQTAAGNKGKLVSLATSSDRTLFFDFLPIEAMSIKGFKTKFQLYTVPGQVIYNTTRQLVCAAWTASCSSPIPSTRRWPRTSRASRTWRKTSRP